MHARQKSSARCARFAARAEAPTHVVLLLGRPARAMLQAMQLGQKPGGGGARVVRAPGPPSPRVPACLPRGARSAKGPAARTAPSVRHPDRTHFWGTAHARTRTHTHARARARRTRSEEGRQWQGNITTSGLWGSQSWRARQHLRLRTLCFDPTGPLSRLWSPPPLFDCRAEKAPTRPRHAANRSRRHASWQVVCLSVRSTRGAGGFESKKTHGGSPKKAKSVIARLGRPTR